MLSNKRLAQIRMPLRNLAAISNTPSILAVDLSALSSATPARELRHTLRISAHKSAFRLIFTAALLLYPAFEFVVTIAIVWSVRGARSQLYLGLHAHAFYSLTSPPPPVSASFKMTETTRNRASVPVRSKTPATQQGGDAPSSPPAASSSVRPKSTAPAREPLRQQDHDTRLDPGPEPAHVDGRTGEFSQSIASLLAYSPTTAQEHDVQDGDSEADRLGVHVKDAMTTIRQLEALGMHNQNVPLPKIIVLGRSPT